VRGRVEQMQRVREQRRGIQATERKRAELAARPRAELRGALSDFSDVVKAPYVDDYRDYDDDQGGAWYRKSLDDMNAAVPGGIYRETGGQKPEYDDAASALLSIRDQMAEGDVEGARRRFEEMTYAGPALFAEPEGSQKPTTEAQGEGRDPSSQPAAVVVGKTPDSTPPAPDQVAQDIERHAQRWEALSKQINPEVPISPKTVREKVVPKIMESITAGTFNDFLRPSNKVSRALFEELTGVKLPKTIRDTEALFTGKPFGFKTNPSESPKSSTPAPDADDSRTPAGEAGRLRARLEVLSSDVTQWKKIIAQGGTQRISVERAGAMLRDAEADLRDVIAKLRALGDDETGSSPGSPESSAAPPAPAAPTITPEATNEVPRQTEQPEREAAGSGAGVRGGAGRPDQPAGGRSEDDPGAGPERGPDLPPESGSVVPKARRSGSRGGGGRGRGGGGRTGQPVTQPEPGTADQPGPRGADEPVAPLRPERPKNVADRNHRIDDADVIAPKGDPAKIRGNLDAIKLLQKLEAEKRNPTPAEKKILARYVGWGSTGVAAALDSLKAKRAEQYHEEKAEYERELAEWKERGWPEWRKPREPEGQKFDDALKWEEKYGDTYREVRSLLSDADFRAIQETTQYAHYTSSDVIRRGIWAAVRRLGFKGGQVLETSAGIGHMIGLQPQDLADVSQWTAVEMDSIPARIMAKLYPEATVLEEDFGRAKIAPASVDLIVGNVPFAATKPTWEGQPKGFSLHNAFLARSIRMLRPGGLMVVITSRSTMDEQASDAFREWAGKDANLIAAVRLPEVAFMANAGTKVTTDILVFQKKKDASSAAEWAHRKKITVPNRRAGGEISIDLNEYFHAHPEMMLGKLVADGLYPDSSELDSTVEAVKGEDWLAKLDEAVQRLPADLAGEGTYERPVATGEGEGTFSLDDDGAPYQVVDGRREPVPPKQREFFKAWIPLKAETLKLFDMQIDEKAEESAIEAQRAKVRAQYRAFAKKHGKLGESFATFRSDPASFRVASIEKTHRTLTERVMRGVKKFVFNETFDEADILTRRTQYPFIEPTKADNLDDALTISRVWKGVVDLDYVGRLLGRTADQVRGDILDEGKAFVDPETGQLTDRDEYLSGLVVAKLAKAEEAAKADPAYAPNVEALKAVQPVRRDITTVSAMLGATWVPPEALEAFAAHTLGVELDESPVSVVYSDVAKAHQAHVRDRITDADRAAGSGGIALSEIIARTINFERITIIERWTENGQERSRTDPVATAKVQYKQEQIQRKWQRWMRGGEWALKLEDAYNDKVNVSVARKHTPPAVETLPGADPKVKLRPHQLRDVFRALQNSHLNSHEVGTGKTYIIISTALEMRRLGLARKPMIVVQNSTVGSYARAFAALYPSARVLVPSDKDFETKNRKRTLQSIASNDWDAVIIPQSQIEKIRNDPEREREYVAQLQDELEQAIVDEGVDPEKARFSRDPKVKVLARRLKAVRDLADKLLRDDSKDAEVMAFEEMGVDALLVDEAHAYKKLAFVTVLPNIKGLDTSFSKRGLNMLMKTRYVQSRRGGKNVHFYTGTPITNTIAEAWTMMRYLRPDVLEAASIGSFDEFVATFALRSTEHEMQGGIMLKPIERLRAFNNVSTLQQLWLQVSDEQTAEDAGIPRPEIEGGGREVKDIPNTEIIAKFMKHLLRRYKAFERMSPKDRYLNKHIPGQINNAARAAAVDIRLIAPDLPDDPKSKLNVVAKEAVEIWKQTESFDGAQVLFLDRFQREVLEPTGKTETDPETGTEVPKYRKVVAFNAFHELRRKLIALGVPAEQIAVMTDPQYEKIDSREPVFEAVRQGKVRFVLATSERAGVGVNMQDRLVALHHIDAPFTAAMMDQREGRIQRQGNETVQLSGGTFKPRIIGWGVRGTYDSGQYERLSRKAKIQWQFRLGTNVGETIDDDQDVLSYAQAAATIADNPLFKRRAELESQIRELKDAEEEFQQGQVYLQRRIREGREEAEARRRNAREVREKIARYYRPYAANPQVSIDHGEPVSTEEELSKAVKEYLERAGEGAANRLRSHIRGQVDRGRKRPETGDSWDLVPIVANGHSLQLEVRAYLDDKEAGLKDLDKAKINVEFRVGSYRANGWVKSHIGIISGIDSLMDPEGAELVAAQLDRSAKELDQEAAKSESKLKATFEDAADLERAEEELKGVMEELAAQGNEVENAPDDEADEWEGVVSNPITDPDDHGGAPADAAADEDDPGSKWYIWQEGNKFLDVEGHPLAVEGDFLPGVEFFYLKPRGREQEAQVYEASTGMRVSRVDKSDIAGGFKAVIERIGGVAAFNTLVTRAREKSGKTPRFLANHPANPTGPVVRPGEREGFLDRLEGKLGQMVRDARADLKSLGIRRGRDTGSEIITRGMVNVAIIAAGTAAQKTVRGGRALGKIVRETIATHAPALKDQAPKIVRIVRGLLADATKPDGSIDQDALGRASEELAGAAKLTEKGPAGVARALQVARKRGGVKVAKRAARETMRLVRRTEQEAEARIDALVPRILRSLRTARRQGAALKGIEARADAAEVAKATKEREAIERGIRRQMAVLLRAMPAEVKANFTETIAAAKTPVDLARAVNRMRRDHALYRARMARRALGRLVKPKRMARLDNARRAAINSLVNSLGPDWQYTKEKGKTATGSLQVARTFVDTLERVRAIYGEHAAETRAIAIQEQMEREGKVKAALVNIRRAKLIKTEPGVAEDAEVSWWARFQRKHLDVWNMLRTIEGEWLDDKKAVILSEWQKLKGDEEGYFNLRRWAEAKLDQYAKRAGFKGLGDAMMRAAGTMGEGSLKRVEIKLGGRKVRIKLDELMHLAALDEDTRTLIDGGAPLKFARGTLRKGISATLEEIDAAVRTLTPEQRSLVRNAKKLIEERRPEVFKVIRYLTGREPKMVWGYFPRSRDSSVPDSGLPSAWKSTDLINKYLENADMGKERTGGTSRAIVIGGLLRTTSEHLDETAKILSFAVRVRRIESLIRHPDVQDAIESRFGASAFHALREHLKAATRVNEQPHTAAGRIAQAISSRISGAFLALNERTWLRQLGGIARLSPVLGVRDFAAGIAGFSRVSLKSMMQASGYLWARYHGDSHARFSPTASSEIEALDEPQFGQSIKAVLRSFRQGRIWEGLTLPMRRLFQSIRIVDWFDSMSARVAWAGFEAKAKREHPEWSDRQRTRWVATKVSDAIRDTQNSTSVLDLSGMAIHVRGTALQPFLAFTSDPFRSYNRWVRARKQGVRAAAGMAAAEAVNIVWSAAATAGSVAFWGGLTGGGDDDEDRRKMTPGQRALWGTASELVGAFVPGGTIVGSSLVRGAQSAVVGLPSGDAVLDAPVLSVMNEIGRSGGQAIAGAIQMADEDPDVAERGQRKLGRALLHAGEGGVAMWGNPVYVPITRIRSVVQEAMRDADDE